MTKNHCLRYTPAVTSKKGVIGIGVPLQSHDESRGLSAESAASLSVPPVLAARMGERKLRRFPQGLPGRPTRSSCRPRLVSGAVVSANHTCLEASMADRIPARALIARTTSPTTGTTDPIQLHATAHNALGTALHHLRQPHVDVARARRKVMQALAALRGLDVALSLEG